MNETWLNWVNTEDEMPTNDAACLVMVDGAPPKIAPHLYRWNKTIWGAVDGDYFDYLRPQSVIAWCRVGGVEETR